MTKDSDFVFFQGISKTFGSAVAVDDVSLGIRRGEFFSLLGPSGCGKTTLLRMLAGLETPSVGEIFLDGQPLSLVPANRRPTNMVFQNYAIFPHLNVQQNIAYGLRKKGLTKRQMAVTVDEALETIKLPGYGSRQPHELSGGQRQRVALARALVCRPRVLLLDEPLGALDKKLREEMQIELRQLQRSVGITFVFVTHDQEEALTMSDRIAVMSKGRVLQVDSPDQLYERPNSYEVAKFIGTMNFFDGELVEIKDHVAVVNVPHLGKRLVRIEKPDDCIGKFVSMVIRPEKIAIGKKPPAPGQDGVSGKLVARAYLGDRNYYYVSVPGISKALAISSPNVTTTPEFFADNEEVWVSWSPDACVLLKRDESASFPAM